MRDVLDALDATVCTAVEGRDVAVAFSGGLDSGLLASLCLRHARSVRLYSVGVEGFPDVIASERASMSLGAEWVHIVMDEETLVTGLSEMVRVTGTLDPVTLSFEVPLMYVLREAREDIVVTGQGADEAFLGYSKYLDLSDERLIAQRDEDLRRLHSVTSVHEARMADHHGKVLIRPFMEETVTEAVSGIPLALLRPEGDSRKRVLREMATGLCPPGILSRPKKAAQYGSGSMDMMRNIARQRGMSVSEFIISLSDNHP